MANKGKNLGGHRGQGYHALANAIIEQAADDYINLKLWDYRHPNRPNSIVVRSGENALRFFKSAWYALLTEVEPDYLIRKLDEKINNEIQRIEKGKKK